jgi:hypothetical protein
MATCPFKIRKRNAQELSPCDKQPNYIVTVEGFPPFRACVVHSSKYKKAGAQAVYKALEKGVADSIPPCDSPPPVPRPPAKEVIAAEVEEEAAPAAPVPAPATTAPLSIGLSFAMPTPDVGVHAVLGRKVGKPVAKKPVAKPAAKVLPTPTTSEPAGPSPVMASNRVEVMDKLLHPIYSRMFEAACNMRVKQKASTRYSKTDTEKVLSLGSLKEDDMKRAIIQGKAARKAVAGEKALEALEKGGPAPKKKGAPPAKKKGPPTPAMPVAPPSTTPMAPPSTTPMALPPTTPMAPPPSMMNMMPQMVVPTYYAPTPMRSVIDAPAPSIIVGPSGMQPPPDGEPIPLQQQVPLAQAPPPQGEGGMAADADGILRFQGGVQADGSAPSIQPQQPERLTGNAFLMAARRNYKGILGCLTLIENVVGALGFPGAIGTAHRLAEDPSFTQCITELLDPTPEADGSASDGPLSFLDIHEEDHGILKTLKLYGGHLANNALNYGTGKATMKLAPSVLRNAQASVGTPTPTPTPTPSSGEPDAEGEVPSDESNEMLPREEAPGEGMPPPPMPMPMGGQMFMMPFTPSSYLVVPSSSAPTDPLHKKVEPPTTTTSSSTIDPFLKAD